MFKWIKRVLLGLAVLLVVAVATVYGLSQLKLSTSYEAQARSLGFLEQDADVEHGERLARVLGCYGGCHGRDMEGRVFFEADWVVRLIAPNITRIVKEYSPAEFEASIRQGISQHGSGLMAMPSDAFSIMTDEDYADLYAFLRSYPEQDDGAEGRSSYGPLGRFFMLVEDFDPAAEHAQAPWTVDRLDDRKEFGAYLATMVCAECHGRNLDGGFGPDLVIAKAYDREQFEHLMRTGEAIDGERDLGVMAAVSRGRFTHFTDAEIDVLHDYLLSR